jgi:hypothetical protein
MGNSMEVVIKGRIDYVIELVRQNLAIVWVMLVTVESILIAAGGLGVLLKMEIDLVLMVVLLQYKVL